MNNAEERAFERYPDCKGMDGGYVTQINKRNVFTKGYHQAEKDLTLTWKDVELLININEDINNEEAMTQVHSNKEHYEEVLKRFNDMFFH